MNNAELLSELGCKLDRLNISAISNILGLFGLWEENTSSKKASIAINFIISQTLHSKIDMHNGPQTAVIF